MSDARRTIMFGATVSVSLVYLGPLPERLVTEGWRVHVASSDGELLRAYGSREGVSAEVVEMARNPSPRRDLSSLWVWIHLLRRVRPDVLVAGTPKAGLLALLAGVFVRVPHRCYSLYGLRFESARGIRRALLMAFERFTMLCATQIIAVGHGVRDEAVGAKLAPASKFVVVGDGTVSGIDTERFAPAAQRLPSEENDSATPVVGFVGRLSKDKGISELAMAAAMLRQRGLEFELLLVGETEDSVAAEAISALKEAGVRYRSVGFVRDPSTFYREMTIFTLPSHREGLPTVSLEAAASGLPVVTTDATGARDAVIDGVTGLAVPVADAVALADALERLLSNPDRAKTMGAAGRIWVVERWERDHVLRLNVEHFEALIGHR